MIATDLPALVSAELLSRCGHRHGDEIAFRCPAHDDRHPSASWNETKGAWTCHACGAHGGYVDLAQRLGVDFRHHLADIASPKPGPRHNRPPFSPDDAARGWDLAQTRARDDRHVDDDRAVYEYVASRRLANAREERAFGVVADGMELPRAIRWWPKKGYQLVAPLYDHSGKIANIQARSIRRSSAKKVLFPAGSRAAGTMFANRAALAVLRGERAGPDAVILGEGLTDYLALTPASPAATVCAPGTSMASACIGTWIAGRTLYVATDRDAAGDDAAGRVASRAIEMGARRVLRVEWPDNAIDACDVIAKRGPTGLGEFLDRLLSEQER